MTINVQLTAINVHPSREARNIDVHTPRSAWAPMERKNVQLMAINVQDLREAQKLMTINVQLMIINIQKNTSAKRDVNINHIRKKHFFRL